MIIACVLIIALTVLLAQNTHYDELQTRREYKNTVALTELLEQRLREVEEYKEKVDTLVSQAGIRSGFKI